MEEKKCKEYICSELCEKTKNQGWIPVKTGLFPEEEEIVQVTYLGYHDNVPYCDEFAYRCAGEWNWTDGEPCKVKITAWKYNCKPYNEN